MKRDSPNTEQLQIWWTETLGGDSGAFSNIHKSLFDGLYYYALKLLDDGGLADDAVQELFVKIWVKRDSIGQVEKVKPYFFTSLRRQVLNQLRNVKLRDEKERLLTQPDIEFSPEEIIVKHESDDLLHEKLLTMLNALPNRQKEAIYLRYFEDMDYNQIAEIMNVNYQSVLNLIQKALQKLCSQELLALFLTCSIAYKIFEN